MSSAGEVDSWEDLERVWKYTFKEGLKINPKGQDVLILESNRSHRHKIAEFFFEQQEVNNLYFINPAVTSLHAMGKTTGLLIQSGYSETKVTPVYENFPVYEAIQKTAMGEKHMVAYLDRLFRKTG